MISRGNARFRKRARTSLMAAERGRTVRIGFIELVSAEEAAESLVLRRSLDAAFGSFTVRDGYAPAWSACFGCGGGTSRSSAWRCDMPTRSPG